MSNKQEIIISSNSLLHETSSLLQDTKEPLRKIDLLINKKDIEILYHEELLILTKEETIEETLSISDFIAKAEEIDEKIKRLKKFNSKTNTTSNAPPLIQKSLTKNENMYFTAVEPRIMLELTKAIEDASIDSLPITQQKSLLPLRSLYAIFINRYPLIPTISLTIDDVQQRTVTGAIAIGSPATNTTNTTITMTPAETIKRLYTTKASQYYMRMTQRAMERYSIRKLKMMNGEPLLKKKPNTLIGRLFTSGGDSGGGDANVDVEIAATKIATTTITAQKQSIESLINIFLEGMKQEKQFIRKFFPHNVHHELLLTIFEPLIDGLIIKELQKKIGEMANLQQLFTLKSLNFVGDEEHINLFKEPLDATYSKKITTILGRIKNQLQKEKDDKEGYFIVKATKVLHSIPTADLCDPLLESFTNELISNIIKGSCNVFKDLEALPDGLYEKDYFIREESLRIFAHLPLFTILKNVTNTSFVVDEEVIVVDDMKDNMKAYQEFQQDLPILIKEIQKIEANTRSSVPRKTFTAEIINLYSLFLLKVGQIAGEGMEMTETRMMNLDQLKEKLLATP